MTHPQQNPGDQEEPGGAERGERWKTVASSGRAPAVAAREAFWKEREEWRRERGCGSSEL